LLAALAGLFAIGTLAGYVLHRPEMISMRPGLQGMSPLTAGALLALAAAVLGLCGKRMVPAGAAALLASAIAVAALASHAAFGADRLSPFVAQSLFGLAPGTTGRTSVATAVAILFVSLACWHRLRRPAWSDPAAGVALTITGTALLGYAYGVSDLYAVPVFNTMALNTALGLFALALAVIASEPASGWAGVVSSPAQGENFTRCLLAFALLPPLVGYGLVSATHATLVGIGAAMALLVMATVLPLALLILRDGRSRIALDVERRQRLDMQAAQALDLELRLAEKVDELRREVAERAKAEQAMQRAQRMEAIGRLTGGIAHDFNNLLQALSGNVSLLQRRIAEDDPSRKFVDNAAKAVQKGAKLTAQLLTFSRSQRLSIAPVSVQAALQDAGELIRHSVGPDVVLELEVPRDDIWVLADSTQLELALVNLAVNARDAMPGGGRLRVGVQPVAEPAVAVRAPGAGELPAAANGFVTIVVADDGCGMTPEVLSQAADPFFTTKQQGKGTGLGLAQVYGFARQCGGDLRMASTPDVGTTVEIVLPLARAPVVAIAQAPSGATHATADSARGHRILVVDDDDSVRAVISQGLLDAGYEVLQAENGPHGLEQLESMAPAALVVDFLMPGMNGAELARRAQMRWPGLPVVFVSGYSDTLALDGIAGAVVLRKPFDLEGLRQAVVTALR